MQLGRAGASWGEGSCFNPTARGEGLQVLVLPPASRGAALGRAGLLLALCLPRAQNHPVPPGPSWPHRSFLSSFCFGGAGVPQAISFSCCIAVFLLGTGLKSDPGENTLR